MLSANHENESWEKAERTATTLLLWPGPVKSKVCETCNQAAPVRVKGCWTGTGELRPSALLTPHLRCATLSEVSSEK